MTDLPEVRLRPMTLDHAGLLEAGHTPHADPYGRAGLRDPGWRDTVGYAVLRGEL